MTASQATSLPANAAKLQRQLIDELTSIAHNWLAFDPAGRNVEQLYEPAFIRLGVLILELPDVQNEARLKAIELELTDLRRRFIAIRESQIDFGGPVPPPDFPRELEPFLRPRWEGTLPPTEPVTWSIPEAPNVWHRGQTVINECSYHGNRYGLHADLGWGYWAPDNRQFVFGRLPVPTPEFLRDHTMRYAKATDMNGNFVVILPKPGSGQEFNAKGRRYVYVIKNQRQAILILLDSAKRDKRLEKSAKYDSV